MSPYLQRHRPLIASRIEFVLEPPPPLPSIRSRIEFTPQRLAYSNANQACVEAVGEETRNPMTTMAESSSIIRPPTAPSQRLGLSQSTKIPKPSGEPGRPTSGGYCLIEVLVKTHKWSKVHVDELSVCIDRYKCHLMVDHGLQAAVRSEARKRLNMTVNFRSQSPDAIEKICEKVCPLHDYQPDNNML
jgi:hypothetical protein